MMFHVFSLTNEFTRSDRICNATLLHTTLLSQNNIFLQTLLKVLLNRTELEHQPV